MSIVAAQRNSVYPNFLFTPLKYPFKTFDQCAGMVVVGHVLLRLQRHWLVTDELSKWWKKTKVNSCVPRSQVYPIFCRTPLKYPLKTFDQCAGMVVVSNARLF